MSSIGAIAMPCRAITSMSNLRFWPIFSTLASSSSGFKQIERRAQWHLTGQQSAAAEQIARPTGMPDGNVAGLAWRCGKREADEIGRVGVEARGLGVEGEAAG